MHECIHDCDDSLFSTNNTWFGSNMYPLNSDGTLGAAITYTSVPSDMLSGSNPVFEYVVKPRDESAIPKIAKMTVTATSKYDPVTVEVTVDGVKQEGSTNLRNIVHTGKSTYGPDNIPCTKVEIKVTSTISGYEGTRTYYFIFRILN